MELKDKVVMALDEGRILVLGAQILLGFEYNAVFMPGFDRLPPESRVVKMVGLCLLLLALLLLLLPVPVHHMVESGYDSGRFHRFTTRVMTMALLPFAIGLGLDCFAVFHRYGGVIASTLGALAMFGTALYFWYILEMTRRRHGEGHPVPAERELNKREKLMLKEKIQHALTEARVVLPGAQAMLGFQFIAVLSDAFERLPASSQYVHVGGLVMTAITIILLMAPAAYHRIVERGELSEPFHAFAGRMVCAALIPLAVGLCGDLYVVVRKVFDSYEGGLVVSMVMLVSFYAAWFGYPIYRRYQGKRRMAIEVPGTRGG
ncbi:MAG: hypothetical protein JWQ98_2650 [Chlorobi bacterium]|jgi:hypothetical protein|nr:hypothetical protein [Chlorobiota bacterium]